MLAPARVDRLQQIEALGTAHQLRVDLLNDLLLALVRGRGVGDNAVDQCLGVDLLGGAEISGRERHRIDRTQAHEHAVDVPVVLCIALRVQLDDALDRLVDPLAHEVGDVGALEHFAALVVDDLALLVQHVVVLEDVLADLEVVFLDASLSAFDLARQELVLDWLALGRSELVEDVVDAIASEEPHDLVLGRQVEPCLTGVALTAGAATQLVVDAAGLMPLGTEHVEAAKVGHAFAELDVDAAAGHVGRDHDGALLARVDDDLALTLVLLGVEDLVRDALTLEQCAQILRRLDINRADENWLPGGVTLGDVGRDRVELLVFGLEDQIFLVLTRALPIGRDRHNLEAVDLSKLVGLGRRGTCHARELVVHAEVVLDRDGRDRDVLGLDLHALFRLDGLMETLAPATTLHDAAGELVDDLDLAVDHDVVDVALEERLGLERLDEVVDHLPIAWRIEVLNTERLLDLVDAVLGRRDGLALLVDFVILGHAHRLGDLGERVVRLWRLLRLPRDDQRRSCLVDQD